MLTNATITRIDRAGTADATGRPRMTAGSAVSIHCALDAISSRQRFTLGAVIEDADQVVFVQRQALIGAAPVNGDQLIILPDGSTTSHTVRVITAGDRIAPSGGAMSHLELYVGRLPS